jgi:phospholipid/cholesterol/gamma-HCH transport system substrate-binding protein
MASTKSLEYKVGALIVISLVLLGGFLALLGNFSFRGGKRIRINYDYSGNLQSGAAVKVSGIKVGKVEEVRYLGGEVDPDTGKRVQVRVVIFVEDRVKDSIRKNAEFFINTEGVLGEQYLEIQPGTWDQPPLDPAHSVEGVNPPRTDLIVARLYEFLDSITGLLKDDKEVIRDFLQSGASVVRTLDDILKTNKVEIGRLLVNVDGLSRQAADLLGSVRAGVGDGKTLKATLGNIEALSASIRRDIDPLIAKAKKALDGVDRVTSVVGPDERVKLQKALDELVVIGDKTQKLTSDAQALVADIRKGKGTAGALLVDPQIYDDLKEMVRDLKRNPWKFFWKE